MPWEDSHEGNEGTHIENDNTNRNLLDCLWQHLTWICCLRCCNPYKFDGLVGKEDHLEGHDKAHPTFRKHLKSLCDIGKTSMSSWRFKVSCYHKYPCSYQGKNGDNLDHPKPKLNFPENLNRNQVNRTQDNQEDNLNLPGRPTREPVLHIGRYSRNFCHPKEYQRYPVRPTREESPALTKVFGNKVDKGVLVRIHIEHLTDRSHHKIHEDTS